MVIIRDVEKGVIDEENKALLGAWNEGRPYDGGHLNFKLEFKKPVSRSCNIANGDVNAEQSNQLEESNVSEGKNESEQSEDEMNARMKLWVMNTSLLEAIATHNNKDVISLLKDGANPNATCLETLTSACHIAAFCNEEALRILLEAGAERRRFDCKGNTPLHYAACSNAPKKIALILGFPEGLTNEVAKFNRVLTPEQEIEIQEIGAPFKTFVDSTETKGPPAFDLPDEWRTNVASRYYLYYRQMVPGHSALHVASCSAHLHCVRLLLAAGANPNPRENNNATPLDVAGASSSDSDVKSYVETLQLIRKYGGSLRRAEWLVLERALRKRSLQALTLLLNAGAPINHRNRSGYTPMHLCVELRLKEHLEVLANHNSLEMDYRAVDVTDAEGSTVLHWAARERWLDGVIVALSERADITHKNSVGDTALHLAAKAGDYDIVKRILDHDQYIEWDFRQENYEGKSLFSNAIFSGNADIVRLMMNLNNEMQGYLFRKIGDLTPLEYAAENNFPKLFVYILKEINQVKSSEVSNIVNSIARHNLWELISELHSATRNSLIVNMNEVISTEFILHEANRHNSRETIRVLLENGADLSQKNNDNQTAISLLMYHVTKPTEFMTEVLDKCIKTDKNIYNKDYLITINYSVLKPDVIDVYEKSNEDYDCRNTKAKDMNVLKALIETGDVYDQRSLLTHPVVESFLYLKWKQCAKFIYVLISAYVLFLISLNTYIATIYYHKDHEIDEQDIFYVFNVKFWRISSLFTLCLFSLVDLLYWTSKKKWQRSKTMCVKWLLTIGGVTMIFTPMDDAVSDIIRGVAVITVSLSWIYLMIYLSWTPTLGYYMQMYGKVFENVIKVMLSFSFPLVGFSICFTILLRAKEPFDGPFAAFLRTMVMMSSEFEYENLVKKVTTNFPKDAKNFSVDSSKSLTSVFMLRIFFLLFLISVAVVLMNLMLSVAVNDLQELSHDSKQRRLMKQVECLSVLENLFQQRPFSMFKWIKIKTMKAPSKVEVKPDSNIFGREMKEIILNKAQSLKETEEKKADDDGMKEKIYDTYDLAKKLSEFEKELSEISKYIRRNVELRNYYE